MNYVILADGTFPVHPVALRVLDRADFVICCDGAVGKLVDHVREPDLIIGDLDSITDELRDANAAKVVHDPDQETNDLTKAVHWCVAHNITEVRILGATGIREDHTLGNISLLGEYCRDMRVLMLTDTGTFEAYTGSFTAKVFPGQQISIFSLSPDTAITSERLRWPLKEMKLSSWWRGTLNEATDDTFSLRFDTGTIIIYRNYGGDATKWSLFD